MQSSPRLRRATNGDASLLADLMAEPTVYEFLGDGHPVPIEIARQWLADSGASFASHGVGIWFLEIDGAADGSFVSLAPDKDGAELAFALHPRLWSQGFASRMALTAMDVGFSSGISTIWAGVDGANGRSEAALIRNGLRHTGVIEFPLGPGARYELARSEWTAPDPAVLIAID